MFAQVYDNLWYHKAAVNSKCGSDFKFILHMMD